MTLVFSISRGASVTHISAEKRGKISAGHLGIETFLTPFLEHQNYCFPPKIMWWVKTRVDIQVTAKIR